MSREATSWVWEHSEARKNDRLVLLVIADECDADGTGGHPSQRRAALLCRCSQSSVGRATSRLEGAGELLVLRPAKPGPGHFSRYAVVMGRDPARLAHELGWPEPALVPEAVAKWEQLTLETVQTAARWAVDGYRFVNRARKVAPYPTEQAGGDNPGDQAGDTPKVGNGSQKPRQAAPSRATQEGADPQTLTTTSTSRPPSTLQRPTEEQTRAVLEGDAERVEQATLAPEEVHEIVARAKAGITEEDHDRTMADPEPEPARSPGSVPTESSDGADPGEREPSRDSGPVDTAPDHEESPGASGPNAGTRSSMLDVPPSDGGGGSRKAAPSRGPGPLGEPPPGVSAVQQPEGGAVAVPDEGVAPPDRGAALEPGDDDLGGETGSQDHTRPVVEDRWAERADLR